jgi:hypothetical protein
MERCAQRCAYARVGDNLPPGFPEPRSLTETLRLSAACGGRGVAEDDGDGELCVGLDGEAFALNGKSIRWSARKHGKAVDAL